jgi:uncharacterized membrane protein YkvA (DUF1232 family)
MSVRRKAAYAAVAAAAVQEGPTGFGARVAAVPRLVRYVITGRYPGMSRGRLVALVLAGLYVISPVDLLPEAFLTLPGLVDDAAVGAWLIASVLGATTAYRSWEAAQAATAHAEPVVISGEVAR